RCEERQGGARGHGLFGVPVHVGGPVLVVAGEDQAFVPGRVDAAGVQVQPGGVGEVVAHALGPLDEGLFAGEAVGEAVGEVGAGEGDAGGSGGVGDPATCVWGELRFERWVAFGFFLGDVAVVDVAAGTAVARPPVVGLPAGGGQDHEEVGGGVVADYERDVVPEAVSFVERGDVGAGNPIRRHVQRPRDRPLHSDPPGFRVRRPYR